MEGNANVTDWPWIPRARSRRMHARLVTPLRNLVVLLSSFFLLAVG